MLIRDRIFHKLEEMNMTQKEFSEKTGIPQTTVSDWRKKKTTWPSGAPAGIWRGFVGNLLKSDY